MEITDVRIKLVTDSTERLRAFCTITFDGEFVVRAIKLVEGVNGMFVAMPSRKLSTSCPKCRHKNPLQSRYCSECGASLPSQKVPTDDGGRLKLYRDIAHPITTSFRQVLQDRVVEAGARLRAALFDGLSLQATRRSTTGMPASRSAALTGVEGMSPPTPPAGRRSAGLLGSTSAGTERAPKAFQAACWASRAASSP